MAMNDVVATDQPLHECGQTAGRKMIDRSETHHARVLIAQAREFRQREKRLGWSGSFSSWLLNCAGRARIRAISPEQGEHDLPTQGELFR